MVTLESVRLIMRNFKKSDLLEYHKLFSDKKNMYYLDDISTETEEESLKSMLWSIDMNEQGKTKFYGIELKENNSIIGSCGYEIMAETPVGKVVHMGWFIMPEYQNKGYMTEAVKKILEYAFLHDNCIRITTGCYRDNAATQKVMVKVGFRKEGEKINAQWHDGKMKDRLDYAINQNEFINITV